MILDTHEEVKTLVRTKLSEDQAEAIVNIINKRDSTLATKSDIALLKSELKSDIALSRSELKTDMIELKNELKADISNISNELGLIKKDFLWMKTLLFSVFGLLLGSISLLIRIAFF